MPEVRIEPTPLIWYGQMRDEDGRPRWPRNEEWKVGAAFYGGMALSNHFLLNTMNVRKPIMVLCPFPGANGTLDATPFCIDSSPTNDGENHWDVTVDLDSLVVGAKPNITVHPSIHLVGFWHGWLKEGVLSQ